MKSNSVPIRWECVWKCSPHRRSDTRLIITLHFTPSWVKFHHILCLLLCLWCLEPFRTLINFWRHNLNIQRQHLTALSCAECIDSCLFAHPADLIPDWLPSFSTLDSMWYLMVYHLLCLFFLRVWYRGLWAIVSLSDHTNLCCLHPSLLLLSGLLILRLSLTHPSTSLPVSLGLAEQTGYRCYASQPRDIAAATAKEIAMFTGETTAYNPLAVFFLFFFYCCCCHWFVRQRHNLITQTATENTGRK